MDTSVQGGKAAQLLLQGRRDGQVQVVVATCLDEVHRVGSLSGGLFVGEVELVEVDLAVGLAAHPVLADPLKISNGRISAVGCVGLVPHVEIT